MAEISPVGMYRAEVDGTCTYVNRRWCELTGRTAESAMGRGWVAAIHPDDRDWLVAKWAAAGRAPLRAEYRYLRPDGSVVWVLGQSVPQTDRRGRITGYIGTVTDVTEMREMREALQCSQADLEARVRARTREIEHLARVVEGSNDAIFCADFNGEIVSVNKAAEAMFGYSAAEIRKGGTLLLTPPNLIEEARDLKARVRNGESILSYETTRVAKNGQFVEVSLSLFPTRDADGRNIGTSAIVKDITERKRHERRLRQLSWRLLRAQDEERRRVARELHDSTSQLLAALIMNLAALERGGTPEANETRRRALLADCTNLAEEAARELRTNCYLLHPPLLDEGGLAVAVRSFVQGFIVRSGIAVALEIDPAIGRLPAPTELALFRVVQEGLTNVLRHAHCQTAQLSLRRSRRWLVLEIRDAGRGLARVGAESAGVGIAGMKERLLHLGVPSTSNQAPPARRSSPASRFPRETSSDPHPHR